MSATKTRLGNGEGFIMPTLNGDDGEGFCILPSPEEMRLHKTMQPVIRAAFRRLHELDQQAAAIDNGNKGRFETIDEQVLNYLGKLVDHHFACEAGALVVEDRAAERKNRLRHLKQRFNNKFRPN